MPVAKKAPAKKAAAKKASAKAAATPATPKKSSSSKAVAKKATSAPPAPKSTGAPAKAATKKASTRDQAALAAAPKKDTTPVKKDAVADAPKQPAFSPEFIEAQRIMLLEERATYLRQANNLQAEADSLAEQREPGDVQFDEESGEGDTLQVERERDLALSARARHEVEEIDRALLKIDAGTYGICEVSGDLIPEARLEAIPHARERVEYKVGGFNRR